MRIRFSPQRRNEMLTVSVSGDVVVVNGEPFDFEPLAEGATLPQEAIDCEWFAGPVTRENGFLTLTLLLPHGANPSLNVAFPAPVVVLGDGPVLLPIDFNAVQAQGEAVDDED